MSVTARMVALPLMRTFAALVLGLASTVASGAMPELVLTVEGHKVTVEVAHTEPTRTQGLMHRRMLPEQRGMLFVFDRIDRHAMWMMNTYVPLSVAFLDARGVIINIADMAPHTTHAHGAAQPAKYALEVNQGWFRKRGIGPGARVEGIEKAPPAR